MAGSNRTLLVGAVAIVAIIAGITAWNARQHPSDPAMELADQGTSAPALTQPSSTDIGVSNKPSVRSQLNARVARDANGKISLLGSPKDREKAKRDAAQMIKDLENAHRNQPIDAAWKGLTETSMREIAAGEAMTATGLTPQDLQSDCRSRSCRISATFNNATDAQDWATFFTTMTGSEFRSVRHVTSQAGDGKTEIKIYGDRR